MSPAGEPWTRSQCGPNALEIACWLWAGCVPLLSAPQASAAVRVITASGPFDRASGPLGFQAGDRFTVASPISADSAVAPVEPDDDPQLNLSVDANPLDSLGYQGGNGGCSGSMSPTLADPSAGVDVSLNAILLAGWFATHRPSGEAYTCFLSATEYDALGAEVGIAYAALLASSVSSSGLTAVLSMSHMAPASLFEGRDAQRAGCAESWGALCARGAACRLSSARLAAARGWRANTFMRTPLEGQGLGDGVREVRESLEITRPDDWHLHLRDGELLERVVAPTARRFGRAIVMPNLVPAVTTVERALAYRERILEACPSDLDFEPLMTLYLTDDTPVSEIEAAARSPHVVAVKAYPRGATTHSSEGVSDLASQGGVLEALAALGLPLLVHGETTSPDCDVFDRERVYLEETLSRVIDQHDALRVVFEHITTKEAVDFVRAAPERVAATLTPQHLLLNRNALFDGGLQPHHYCLPVLKRERDRRALLAAATSGDPSFFLGTDSAPHTRAAKESECGCAGIYSAPIALEAYAEAFASVGALDRLEGFASHFGADFYGLPRNRDRVRLVAQPWSPPDSQGEGESALRVFLGGRPLRYRVLD